MYLSFVQEKGVENGRHRLSGLVRKLRHVGAAPGAERGGGEARIVVTQLTQVQVRLREMHRFLLPRGDHRGGVTVHGAEAGAGGERGLQRWRGRRRQLEVAADTDPRLRGPAVRDAAAGARCKTECERYSRSRDLIVRCQKVIFSIKSFLCSLLTI